MTTHPSLIWLIFGLLAIAFLMSILWKNRKDEIVRLNILKDKLMKDTQELRSQISKDTQELRSQISIKTSQLRSLDGKYQELESLTKERAIHFPSLSTAYGDHVALLMAREADDMVRKKNPAKSSAEKLREYSRQAREIERNFRLTKYRIDFYEKLFPWLVDLSGESILELLEANITHKTQEDIEASSDERDPARKWLSTEEWNGLSSSERNQKALDRWCERKDKSNWEIGRDFERFVGFQLEMDGFSVEYFGAIEGYEDLGRDIIARKSGDIRVIQCKYWSKRKQINEKHVYQTMGTVLDFCLTHDSSFHFSQSNLFRPLEGIGGVTAWLVTSTILSERAKLAAHLLGVRCVENVDINKYPMIKCNVSDRKKEKIYHLPFDINYDRTKIIPSLGERYVQTTKEAEEFGFRRAWRWRGAPAPS